ncbi:MAG TPA: hypothetical protein VIH17_14210, partial [Candidatus Acidoferrales bacterium]
LLRDFAKPQDLIVLIAGTDGFGAQLSQFTQKSEKPECTIADLRVVSLAAMFAIFCCHLANPITSESVSLRMTMTDQSVAQPGEASSIRVSVARYVAHFLPGVHHLFKAACPEDDTSW